jgi:hypothetical protein
MEAMMSDDLTDIWHGRFSFPRLYEPVSFTARLEQSGDNLAGTIGELAPRGAAAGLVLTSTISGTVKGGAVTFLKTYDALVEGYDSVHYAGAVFDGGLEINGDWTIRNDWAGAFLMIRSRGLYQGILRREAERV